uniref:Cytochrome P450 n=1 Tax=Acrobeloides nanus TaxID=290746 RepID=A0A914D137_9BILA
MIIYILAKLPEIQDRLRDEINNILEDREDIGYDDIAKFQYMNQVICETMRMYPTSSRANRVCTKPITINGIEFKENFMFSVPIYAIHHDEKYYPNPDEFDPERFSPEEKAKRDPLAFLSFGYGPRNCIGMRFAEFEIRATLAYMIKHYKFYPAPNSPNLPLEIDTRGLMKPKETLHGSEKSDKSVTWMVTTSPFK